MEATLKKDWQIELGGGAELARQAPRGRGGKIRSKKRDLDLHFSIVAMTEGTRNRKPEFGKCGNGNEFGSCPGSYL